MISGLNDSEGRDTEHIVDIIETLKGGGFINTFLIVRNGHETRMSKPYTDMLSIFELMFGVSTNNFHLFAVQVTCTNYYVFRKRSGSKSSLMFPLEVTQRSQQSDGLMRSRASFQMLHLPN